MIHAYQEKYVTRAQHRLATAFDYAVNVFNIPAPEFINMFIVSSYSKRIEKGDTFLIFGRSGIELVLDIYHEITLKDLEVTPELRMNRTVEYWVGWAIAYYQWYSNRTFAEIFEVFSFEELQQLYYPLHETDISKFVEIVDERVKSFFHETNLKRIHKNAGLKQAELAKQSGVNIRSIQMYEQRNNDINKASFETVYRLSNALGCDIERLFEY